MGLDLIYMPDLAFGSIFASSEAFLRTLYRYLLRREPDGPGMKAYLAQLNSGTSRLDIIKDLLLSPEYEALARKDEEFVQDLYLAVLKRAPVPGADSVEDWVATVRSAGHPAAIDLFFSSPEVVSLYETCDSFLCSSSSYGNAGIVFRGGRLILRHSTSGGHTPLEITPGNWPVLKAYLELMGLQLAIEQIESFLQR